MYHLHADVNGDALPDGVLVSLFLDASGLPLTISVALGRGDAWDQSAPVWYQSPATSPHSGPGLSATPTYLLADINDDLMKDLVVVQGDLVYTLLSSGSSFVPQLVAPGTNATVAPVVGPQAVGAGRRLHQEHDELGPELSGGEGSRPGREAKAEGGRGGLSRRRRAALQALRNGASPIHKDDDAVSATSADGPSVASGPQLPSMFSARQLVASKRLLAHTRSLASASQSPPLLQPQQWADAQQDAGRRRLQSGGAPLALLAVLAPGIRTQCAWYSYGVQLVLNAPGDQLLLACPDGERTGPAAPALGALGALGACMAVVSVSVALCSPLVIFGGAHCELQCR